MTTYVSQHTLQPHVQTRYIVIVVVLIPLLLLLGLRLTHSPHLLVRAIGERFLPAGGTFEIILTGERHWLQPMLVLFVH